MKKIKKLTALISALTLAVCAIPANVCAIYAKDEKLDWDNDGYTYFMDGYYFINYMEYIENRPITDFSMYDIDIEDYIESEGGIEEITKKRDLNDDGVIDKRDFVIFGQLLRDSIYDIVYGDVNKDGRVDAVDGYMLKYYFEDLEDGNEDFYSATQISLFKYRGDANEDGVVDMTDADFILNGGYAEKLHSYFAPNTTVGKVSLDEFLNDNSDSGDVNHDGFVDARDATLVSLYYAYLSTQGPGHEAYLSEDVRVFYDYTEEQIEDMYAYGDVNKDGYVNAIDAAFIATKYARNSTQQ
ncbi:MAG: hypothetical protein K2J32_02965 [Ruminococcus sp.]|nr:hypothetical protein [Ruminococcus sp.]